ncbi:hypothetical protein EV207_104173 [Scopulibacillus darangshiensis]|uniref:Uncharacterized protein n=1 Tax=Scopulibacillus darangshiensis TaxID=442528 RepID=A0A4R2P9U0_9BACL|nr:hypothetical protein [Scopulibacillus darangshiensis]TCP30994.1 hypothetical protein EV207_104173 [Scopulibacillus darangshiensis]
MISINGRIVNVSAAEMVLEELKEEKTMFELYRKMGFKQFQ